MGSIYQMSKIASEPAYLKITNVNINGHASKRCLLILRTNGCSYNMCSMCGFEKHTICTEITSEQMTEQFESGIKAAQIEHNPIEQIDILTGGSFLDEQEVYPEFRIRAMKRISEMAQIRKILIESRTEFISKDSLKSLKAALRSNQMLEVAVGVETSDDYLRNKVLKKALDWECLEKTVEICSSVNVGFQAYLLIKPQTLSENEAISDAVQSAEKVAELANICNVPFRIAFQPVFIPQNTALERAYQAGEYELVNLWSVVEVIKRTYRFGTIFVGLSDENLSLDRRPKSCPLCTKKIYRLIDEFNGTQDIGIFNSLLCSCRDIWKKKLSEELPG
jgi:archaeosine synthase beta-subunit